MYVLCIVYCLHICIYNRIFFSLFCSYCTMSSNDQKCHERSCISLHFISGTFIEFNKSMKNGRWGDLLLYRNALFTLVLTTTQSFVLSSNAIGCPNNEGLFAFLFGN